MRVALLLCVFLGFASAANILYIAVPGDDDEDFHQAFQVWPALPSKHKSL